MEVAGEEDESEDGEVGKEEETSIDVALEVEAKKFYCRRSNGVLVLVEWHKRWERKILLSRGQLKLIGEVLLARSKSVGILRKKERKFVDEEEIFVVEGRNSWGSFISFHVGKGPNFVVFPAGKKGDEWFRASQWIKGCLPLVNDLIPRKPVSAQVVTVIQRRSFADVVRSCESSHHQGLEEKICELSTKLDKAIEELHHYRLLVAHLEEVGATFTPVSCAPICEDKDMNLEIFGPDPLIDNTHSLLEVISSDQGSLLSWEEFSGCSSEDTGPVGETTAISSLFHKNDCVLSSEEDDMIFMSRAFQDSNFDSATTTLGDSLTESQEYGDHWYISKNCWESVESEDLVASSCSPPTHCLSMDIDILQVEEDQEHLKEKRKWERWATKLKEKLRKKEKEIALLKEKLPEGNSTGKLILIDGELFEGSAIYRMLIPPPRTNRSRLAYYYWSSLVGRPLLQKLKDAGFEVDLDLYEKAVRNP